MSDATHLKALREYVANVLDYDPTNPTYKSQVDRLLNEADRRICNEKLYTFAQRTVEVSVLPDQTIAGGVDVVNGSAQIDRVGGFEDWMEGQTIRIEEVDYKIAWVESADRAHLTEELTLATATYPAVAINRWIYLPQDCVQLVTVARRSDTPSATNPGLLDPITQYEDEWANLPFGETGLPQVWVPGNPVGIDAPRVGVSLDTVAGTGQGVRTVEVAVVYENAGIVSAISEVQTITLSDLQKLRVTPISTLPASKGLYRVVYLRAPEHGLDDWRRAQLDSSGALFRIDPTSSAAVVVKASLDHLQSELYYLESRLTSASGVADRLRLYPRQSEAMPLTLRYLADHQPMVEDSDVSMIPPAHRMIIAYRALYEVLVKHNNPTLAELYRKRYDYGLLQLERRYLSQPSRRFVKGYMTPSQISEGPFRRRKLVRL